MKEVTKGFKQLLSQRVAGEKHFFLKLVHVTRKSSAVNLCQKWLAIKKENNRKINVQCSTLYRVFHFIQSVPRLQIFWDLSFLYTKLSVETASVIVVPSNFGNSFFCVISRGNIISSAPDTLLCHLSTLKQFRIELYIYLLLAEFTELLAARSSSSS
jgi:hypothetical protein